MRSESPRPQSPKVSPRETSRVSALADLEVRALSKLQNPSPQQTSRVPTVQRTQQFEPSSKLQSSTPQQTPRVRALRRPRSLKPSRELQHSSARQSPRVQDLRRAPEFKPSPELDSSSPRERTRVRALKQEREFLIRPLDTTKMLENDKCRGRKVQILIRPLDTYHHKFQSDICTHP